MELADSSRLSTPPDTEPVMDCSLVLTTLSGVTIKVSLSVAKFDRFEDLEDQVMDYLVSVTDLKVFGCSIDFLQTATQTYLEDPIWDKLQQSMEYTIVFRDSSVILPSQEQLEGCPIYHVPLAVHVPMNPEEIVPEGAFPSLGDRVEGSLGRGSEPGRCSGDYAEQQGPAGQGRPPWQRQVQAARLQQVCPVRHWAPGWRLPQAVVHGKASLASVGVEGKVVWVDGANAPGWGGGPRCVVEVESSGVQ